MRWFRRKDLEYVHFTCRCGASWSASGAPMVEYLFTLVEEHQRTFHD